MPINFVGNLFYGNCDFKNAKNTPSILHDFDIFVVHVSGSLKKANDSRYGLISTVKVPISCYSASLFWFAS